MVFFFLPINTIIPSIIRNTDGLYFFTRYREVTPQKRKFYFSSNNERKKEITHLKVGNKRAKTTVPPMQHLKNDLRQGRVHWEND